MMKNMIYFELSDHMKNDCCPICSLVVKRSKQAMDGFLYESVNDGSLQERIKKSRGICNFHSRMLKGFGDPLAHAILYHFLLEQAILDLESMNPKKMSMYQRRDTCMFCERSKESETAYLDEFLKGYSHEDFREKYRHGGLLCMPHLGMLIAKDVKQQYIKRIIADTSAKYKDLMLDLQEIQRKNDYRYMHEPWTEKQKMAWQKAVDVINDSAGLRK